MRQIADRLVYRPAVLVLALAYASPVEAQIPQDRQVVCREIAGRYQTEHKPLSVRKANFFLFDAAARGCDALMDQFLEAGASITARDRFGNTPLGIAARMGQRETVKRLIALGSDVNHQNIAGSSVLLRAVTLNRKRVAKILLKVGADPNLPNIRGITPLIAAAFNGNARLLSLLLDGGAEPNSIDSTGKAAIVYAAGRGYPDIVKALIDAGAEPDGVYGNGLTPLMWAAGHANDVPEAEGLATVELILAAQPLIDRADNRGRTALMIAAERGHAAIAAKLIQSGAARDLRDNDGASASDLATDAVVRETLKAR